MVKQNKSPSRRLTGRPPKQLEEELQVTETKHPDTIFYSLVIVVLLLIVCAFIIHAHQK